MRNNRCLFGCKRLWAPPPPPISPPIHRTAPLSGMPRSGGQNDLRASVGEKLGRRRQVRVCADQNPDAHPIHPDGYGRRTALRPRLGAWSRRDLPVAPDDLTPLDGEHRAEETSGRSVAFWMMHEGADPQLACELGIAAHPLVGLLLDPIGADDRLELVARTHELSRERPLGTNVCGGSRGFLEQAAVRLKIAKRWGEMKES